MKKGTFVCCLGVLFLAYFPALAEAQIQKLTWAPPLQIRPMRVSVAYNAKNPALLMVTTNPYPYDHPVLVQTPVTASVEIRLPADVDAILTFPQDKVLAVPAVNVAYGRHVRVIGGSLKATQPASEMRRGLLRFAGQSGSVFVEGVVLDAAHQNGLDGLLVGGVTHAPTRVADVYVQNSFIKGTWSGQSGLHADGFQYYGATRSTRFDRVSVVAQYQGLFLDPQYDIAGIDLRHVDLRYETPETGGGYAFFLRLEKDRPRHPPVSLQEVYVAPRTNAGPWEEGTIYPPAHFPNGVVLKDGKGSFPAFPEVKGFLNKGIPSAGPWVRETSVGLHYVSPGYI